jgi:hypothetical protein
MADDNKPTLLVVEECAQTYHSRGPGAGRRRARRGDRHGDGDEALDLVVATRTVVDSSRFGNRPGGRDTGESHVGGRPSSQTARRP